MGTTSPGRNAGVPTASLPPTQVTQGWAYVVRPPAWPIGSTPGQRGGVRIASIAQEVHVVLLAEPTIDRIFFLGGRSNGGSIACTLTVESIDSAGTPVQSVNIQEGGYVERKRNPLSPTPPPLVQLRYDILPETDPIRLFLATVFPGGSGSGGVGGDSGGGSGGGGGVGGG